MKKPSNPALAHRFPRGVTPRALVLDDNGRALEMTARRLRSRGFDVIECRTRADFEAAWDPGMFDVLVADWQLAADYHGDAVLQAVRERDWDVPFVLVSGRLGDDAKRSPVLATLLQSGNARFVVRGDSGIRLVCEAAEDLIERRDHALLKVILALRPAARKELGITTSSGRRSVRALLADILARPGASDVADEPIASGLAGARTGMQS